MGLGGTAGFDATLSDKALSAAMSQLVENIINKCMDKPWQGYILAKEEDSFIISGGTSQGINTGDVFNVYTRGKKIKNPQSGMMVELPGKKIGAMTILMSIGDVPENEVSFCTYEGEDIDIENLEKYFQCDLEQVRGYKIRDIKVTYSDKDVICANATIDWAAEGLKGADNFVHTYSIICEKEENLYKMAQFF